MPNTKQNDPKAKEISNSLDIVWSHESGFMDLAYRRVFNHRRPTRVPLAVVKIHCEDDIVNAVKLANLLDARVSVISGGHSWAAWGVRDEAILIDLGDFKSIVFNDDTQTVVASTSVTGRILNKYLIEEKGRFFPGGHCPDVGIGGFLLQGGMGWCCRGWGWACQLIESMRVVLHDGKVVTCSRDENTDLFWLARGSGPGFPGVVVEFELRTLPQKVACASTYIHPIEKFKEVIDWVTTISPTTDKDVETVSITKRDPVSGKIIVVTHIVTFKDNSEDCLAELDKFHSTKVPGAHVEIYGAETSLQMEYNDQVDANPERHRFRADNVYLKSGVDVAKVLEPCFTTVPNSKTFCLYFSMDPLTELEDMALSMQTEHYIAVYSVTDTEKEDDVISTWLARSFAHLEKYSEGAYLGDSDFQTRITPFWKRENHEKLNILRKRFDPFRRFCGYLKHPVDEKKNNEILLSETIHHTPNL